MNNTTNERYKRNKMRKSLHCLIGNYVNDWDKIIAHSSFKAYEKNSLKAVQILGFSLRGRQGVLPP